MKIPYRFLSYIFIFAFISSPLQAYTRDAAHLKTPKPKPSWSRLTTTIENLQWDVEVKNLFYNDMLLQFRDKHIKVDSSKDKELVGRLDRILKRLKPHSLLPNLPLEVHLVDDPYVNAICIPGGGILFFKGLFDSEKGLVNVKDDDEIAAVMAHEMAHANLRHSYRMMRNVKSVEMVGDIIATGLGISMGEELRNLFEELYYAPVVIYLFKYNRSQESQADLEGLYTMMKAGYHPEKMIAIWERAAKKKGGKDKHTIFDTHPSNGKRAKALANALEQIRSHENLNKEAL